VNIEIRFWDTSAILKVFDSDEADHNAALALWDTRRGRFLRRSSMIAGIEAVQAARAQSPKILANVQNAVDKDIDLVPFDDERFKVALEIAKRRYAKGADTAIVASAIFAQRRTSANVTFITADEDQAKLARECGLEVTMLRPTTR